jgi:hypothetical protein
MRRLVLGTLGTTIGIGLAASVVMALLAEPALAGDKGQETMTNSNVSAGQAFTDGVSKGKAKFSNPKISLSMKGLNLSDTDQTPCTNDDIICLLSTTEVVTGGNLCTIGSTPCCGTGAGTCSGPNGTCSISMGGCQPCSGTCSPQGTSPIYTVIALYGEVLAGSLKFNHDVCAESVNGNLCSSGTVPLSTYDEDMVCYKADPAYRAAHMPIFALNSPDQCMGLVSLGTTSAARGADSGGSFAVPANGILSRQGESIFQ